VASLPLAAVASSPQGLANAALKALQADQPGKI